MIGPQRVYAGGVLFHLVVLVCFLWIRNIPETHGGFLGATLGSSGSSPSLQRPYRNCHGHWWSHLRGGASTWSTQITKRSTKWASGSKEMPFSVHPGKTGSIGKFGGVPQWSSRQSRGLLFLKCGHKCGGYGVSVSLVRFLHGSCASTFVSTNDGCHSLNDARARTGRRPLPPVHFVSLSTSSPATLYAFHSSSAVALYPFKAIETKWTKYYAENSGDFSPPLPRQHNNLEDSERVRELKATMPESHPLAGTPSEETSHHSDLTAFPSLLERRKFYILSMIPYPSGAGLHVGHSLTYTVADVVARYQRLRLRGELVKSRENADETRRVSSSASNRSCFTVCKEASDAESPTLANRQAESPLTELRGSLESTSHHDGRLAQDLKEPRAFKALRSIHDKPEQGPIQKDQVACSEANVQGQTTSEASAEGARQRRRAAPQPDVLHVMGWDSFGLPAEQHALASGISPRLSVQTNIDRFRQQLRRLGVCVDWRREVNTSSPEFYRWTQWIFVQMMKRGLVYEKLANVNWCEGLGTVLANEEVIDGFSERGGFPVSSRQLRQWHLRITAYADRLLDGLKSLDWPADVKRMQRNWIGRRDVLLLDLSVSDCVDGVEACEEPHEQERAGFNDAVVPSGRVPTNLRCVAISPELIFGATFVVVHSSHHDAGLLARTAACRNYLEEKAKGGNRVSAKEDRCDGQFSGVMVDHPVIPDKKLPVWMSDSLFTQLHGFGGLYNETDALLVVPESQARAREFAQQKGIHVAHIIEMNGEAKRSSKGGKQLDLKSNDVIQKTNRGADPTKNAGEDVNQNTEKSGTQGAEQSGEGVETAAAVAHIDEGYGSAQVPTLSCSSGALDAKLVNSSVEGLLSLDGMSLGCARQEVIRFFTMTNSRGRHEVRYAMRDWLFSRQRFWGEPIPLIRSRKHGEASHVVPVNEADLPVLLPEELPLKGGSTPTKDEVTTQTTVQEKSEIEARDLSLHLSASHNTEKTTDVNDSASQKGASTRTSLSPLLTQDDETTATTLSPLYSLPDWWNVTLAVDQVDGMNMATSVKNSTEDELEKATSSSSAEGSAGGPQAVSLQRETSTMPQWAGSSWYFLRFLDPRNTREPFTRETARFWMPVDMYVGGKEHAVTHLLYARFWHKVLHDLGRVACDEPFQRLVTPGIILGSPKYFMFKRQDTGKIVSSETVELMDKMNLTREENTHGMQAVAGGSANILPKEFNLSFQVPDSPSEILFGVHAPSGQPVYGVEVPPSAVDVSAKGMPVLKVNGDVQVYRRHEKMSKSRGNVVSPDSIIDAYGADSLRLYLLFMGPLEARKMWNTSGVVGAFRFLNRVWNLLVLSAKHHSSKQEGHHCSTVTGFATVDNSLSSNAQGVTPATLNLTNTPPSSFERELMKLLVARVTADIERMSLNTAIAALMANVRKLTAWTAKGNRLSVGTAIDLVKLLHPFAPFVTEELWQMIHASFPDVSLYSTTPSLLASATWPTPSKEESRVHPRSGRVAESENEADSIVFSIHVDGKLQGTVHVPRSSMHDEGTVSALATTSPCLKKWEILLKSGGRGFTKIVCIPARRVINFVTGTVASKQVLGHQHVYRQNQSRK
ncbi:leucyl-tRNA synthetase (LeuRS2) [Toxoplasma gondii GAB2-2007-GAL-DOM2]|uniref:leucine--tRNA ligase n=8 Tax=Toxoplasma gondii TaxID=5811 RepID=A0A125YYG3_TOXGV|nr:leucyl-tRNA synthetase (LeuRS2) [Toxoplasma gondii GT1]ESS33496.1 leucyl-tRNA synthetase (LeuRS2) [Toxoplasma gondii VEG]KAF4644128.1 leucyl-tRNA synthetase (LeuRS2) [Toxoplasma gondii]KFG38763.1 leucyl-tRNA synthetase (LeuRS2) [Toxoplasma gondii GAB2-2007-GAL-DOM2]KFG43156.1 leucyl-tRNA synthetase (LeuRS2) [Toxoplasma gondii FOU]KFH01801.1 leucyl-tRNA synthetase (LeuRS2) [Toxoplasma gondii VAND]RQX74117.1 leucyl-tRNA synthetase (LeuRS2) [Toxoplasma gondii CAST]